ncbi:MAG: 3-dehydroquinate synthase [Gemmatimonas sp.]|nr:3-dehydroquinate synthase [Gemmatimonas sp.]
MAMIRDGGRQVQKVVKVSFNEGRGPSGYEIRIASGVLDSLPTALAEDVPAHRYAVVADSNVRALYGDRVLSLLRDAGLTADLFSFPAGESSKTRREWARLSDELVNAGLGRDAAVLALGGGVTGDLAGFVASTYLRGLPLVQLPTSLLAMIDSSVGGKTGVDTKAGKNLIGTFHQPALVLADPQTLSTLPAPEVRSGLAEAVKHGAIADAGYFGWIAGASEPLLCLDSAATAQLIARSVEIKAAVVGADEYEGGLRKTLNFGHTIGHAVEALSKFELLHGESIAIGMVVEATIGEAIGTTRAGTADQLRDTLGRCGLPTHVPADFAPEAILDLTRVDKKARAGRVEYSLLEEIGVSSRGTGKYGMLVANEVVMSALEENRIV